MKLLVLSDSHRHDEKLLTMIMDHPEADGIIFLGDGEYDFACALEGCHLGPEKIICQVRGNCDLASREPAVIVREFGNVRFLITHGHEQNVKYGLWGLVEDAKKHQCTAALFGHTHRKHYSEKDGITLINPGSAAEDSYCLLEVTNGAIRLLN